MPGDVPAGLLRPSDDRPTREGEYDRPVRLRLGIAVILAVLAGAVIVAVAEGQDRGSATNVPSNERTDPKIRPPSGSGLTIFTLTFTLRHAPGHEGVTATEYRVQVAAPPDSGSSCIAPQPPAIVSGTAGALEQVSLTPGVNGWCTGTYLVTVLLQRGPYCPPPQEGQQPIPCPEFVTQELDTGSANFTVGPSAPLVRVPNLRGLKPAIANRLLKRRHLRVHYTALSNSCAGIPPQGRIILQEPAAGTKAPRGSRVLVQTSCAT
jgi:hypothetical protein